MRQPKGPILNAAQRLMLKVKAEQIAVLTETATFKEKSPPPKPLAPIIIWDGKDSLDSLMASSSAAKYRVDDKATKVLGMLAK